MYKPRSKWEWGFLGTVASQAAVTTGLEVFILIHYEHWINPNVYQVPRSYTIPVNVGLFVLGCLWQLLLTYDAVRLKNNIQLFALCACNACLFVFGVMHYGQTRDTAKGLNVAYDGQKDPLVKTDMSFWADIKPPLITVGLYVGACTLIMCAVAYKLHNEFAWEIYKRVSANVDLKSRYLAYQIFLVLMKLGVYFFIAFCILYGLVNVHYVQPEFGIVMALIPLAILQIFLAVYVTRHESKFGMAVVILLFCGAVGYLINRIVALCGKGQRANSLLKDEMLLFAVVALFFVFFALLNSIQCLINFGRGLKPVLLGDAGQHPLEDPEESYRFERLLRTNASTEMLTSRRFALD